MDFRIYGSVGSKAIKLSSFQIGGMEECKNSTCQNTFAGVKEAREPFEFITIVLNWE